MVEAFTILMASDVGPFQYEGYEYGEVREDLGEHNLSV